MPERTRVQRFWEKVDFNGPIKRPDLGPCWVWTGTVFPVTGYGYAGFNTKTRTAYRWLYEQVVGPVPDGLELDHLCMNRLCVRPDHLEPVTHRENILRSPNTTPGINARKIECDRGHPLSGDNLRIRSCGRRECIACARIRSQKYEARKRARLSGK